MMGNRRSKRCEDEESEEVMVVVEVEAMSMTDQTKKALKVAPHRIWLGRGTDVLKRNTKPKKGLHMTSLTTKLVSRFSTVRYKMSR